MEERRVKPRVAISFPVECKALPQRNYFYTVSKDISVAGLKIVSYQFLPKDNYLTVYINLLDAVAESKARVVWCNKDRSAERYLSGLEFVETNTRSRSIITNFLEKIFHD